jgi:hypothetical protein
MNPDSTNLLPEERVRALRRDYWLRLAALALSGAALVVAANAALLIPSYGIMRAGIEAKQNELAALKEASASSGAAAFATALADLNARAAALAALGSAPADVPLLAEVLSVAHPGVSLTGFSFVPQKKGKPESVVVSGVAATRDALRSYDLALSRATFVASVDLPVSAYAAESALPFTLTIVFTAP